MSLILSDKPRKLSDMEHRLTTRLSKETYAKLSERARRERKSESVVIREALEAHLEETESAYDMLMRIGGLGISKGGPTDLSINKKYMEGFGENRSRSSRHGSARRTPKGR